jgi:hypothetical protein
MRKQCDLRAEPSNCPLQHQLRMRAPACVLRARRACALRACALDLRMPTCLRRAAHHRCICVSVPDLMHPLLRTTTLAVQASAAAAPGAVHVRLRHRADDNSVRRVRELSARALDSVATDALGQREMQCADNAAGCAVATSCPLFIAHCVRRRLHYAVRRPAASDARHT